MPKRLGIAIAITALFSLTIAAAALAAGHPGTVTMTTHGHDEVLFSSHVTDPCDGEPGRLRAVAANDVFHVTSFTNSDEFWITGTGEGTATFTPTDPSGLSASGHFTAWFGESSNQKNDVQHDTNTFRLVGTDGSVAVVHATDHLSTNAQGQVTVNFSKFHFTCS